MSELDEITAMLAESDALEARLVDIKGRISAASRKYWSAKGYRVMPRPEAMRREVARV